MTVACLICFSTNLQSSRNPLFVSGTWTHVPPNLDIDVTFDVHMDVGSIPANGSWTTMIGAAPVNVTAQVWQDAFTLRINYFLVPPPAFPITLELNIEDAGLHGFGNKNVLPFGPVVIPAA